MVTDVAPWQGDRKSYLAQALPGRESKTTFFLQVSERLLRASDQEVAFRWFILSQVLCEL